MHEWLTANIGKRGNSACMQRLLFVAAFLSVDKNALRKPRLPILANRETPSKAVWFGMGILHISLKLSGTFQPVQIRSAQSPLAGQ